MSGQAPEITGLLLTQAQQGHKLAELGEALAAVDGRLGELAIVVRGVRGTQAAQGELLFVIHAEDTAAAFLGFRESREQEAGENRDDGDNYQQFDQSEGVDTNEVMALVPAI